MAAEVISFTGWTFDHIYKTLTWPRYMALCEQWSKWPPLIISSARQAGMGPDPERDAKKNRKLVATGDPDFPYLYEATSSEITALRQEFGDVRVQDKEGVA